MSSSSTSSSSAAYQRPVARLHNLVTQLSAAPTGGNSRMAPKRCPITSHILDTTLGRPAKNVAIHLEVKRGQSWVDMGRGLTNDDGRVETLLPVSHVLEPDIYRLTFDTASYFQSIGSKSFYPEVSIVFEIERPEQHYHVPLLLNPYGYSTYRGS